MGLSKNPDINQMVFPRVIVFFSSYRFSKCWLHTLMKQFILCFLCGISPYNHELHIRFSGKSLHLQSLLLRTCPINNIMYMYEHRYRFFPLIVLSSENYI